MDDAGPGVRFRERSLGDRDEFAHPFREDRLHERLALGEVAIQGADTDACASRDRVEGSLDALFREELAGRFQEQRVVPLGIAARSGRPLSRLRHPTKVTKSESISVLAQFVHPHHENGSLDG